MTYHLGRLIDHVHLAVRDLPRSKNFYLAIFEALGVDDRVKAGGDWLEIDELFIDSADGGGPARTWGVVTTLPVAAAGLLLNWAFALVHPATAAMKTRALRKR